MTAVGDCCTVTGRTGRLPRTSRTVLSRFSASAGREVLTRIRLSAGRMNAVSWIFFGMTRPISDITT
ncbi:hypothetical protein D3C77_769360 [compost metagenome]